MVIPQLSRKYEAYRDHETGKTLRRPDFDRLQQDIFRGDVKTVIVWKLDRLSRRLRDGVNLLAAWCERGVRVIVITQRGRSTTDIALSERREGGSPPRPQTAFLEPRA